MGPNLRRLFDETKDGSPFAPVILGELFATHGEALIAALETLVDGCDTPEDYEVAYRAAKRLLAQLEVEAQP